MSTSGARAWIPEINVMRGFAIIAVIIIHVTTYSSYVATLNLLTLTNGIVNAFVHFAIPVFILISGVVLARNYWTGMDKGPFYKRRLWYILPQYALFSVVYLALYSVVLGSPLSLTTAVGSLLYGTASYHLWYIPLIVELTLLYPLLVKIYDHLEKGGKVKLMILSSLVIQIAFAGAQIVANWQLVGNDGLNQLLLNSFPGYLFFFVLGIHMGRRFEECEGKIRNARLSWVAVAAAISTAAASLYVFVLVYGVPPQISLPLSYLSWSLAMPVLAVSVFALLFRLSSWLAARMAALGRPMDDLGTYSFGIYLVHPMFIYGLVMVMNDVLGISYSNALFYPSLVVLTVFASYVFVKVVSLIPHGDLLLGVRSRAAGRSRIAAPADGRSCEAPKPPMQ